MDQDHDPPGGLCRCFLGQMRVPEHQGEVTARALLAQHALPDHVVPADAQLTERPLSRQVLAPGGDCLLVVKANRPARYEPSTPSVRMWATTPCGKIGASCVAGTAPRPSPPCAMGC